MWLRMLSFEKKIVEQIKDSLLAKIQDGKEDIEDLYDRIEGRYAFETIKHPETGEIIVTAQSIN